MTKDIHETWKELKLVREISEKIYKISLEIPSNVYILERAELIEFDKIFKKLRSKYEQVTSLAQVSNIEYIEFCQYFILRKFYAPKVGISQLEEIKGIKKLYIMKYFREYLGIEEPVTIISDIYIVCPCCKSLEFYSVVLKEEKNDAYSIQYCSNCNHKLYIVIDPNFLNDSLNKRVEKKLEYLIGKGGCKCGYCKTVYDEITNIVNGFNVHGALNEITERFGTVNNVIENKSLRLRNINKNSLTKTEREILSYSPSNVDDFKEIIEIVLAKQENYNKKENAHDVLTNFNKKGYYYELYDIEFLKETVLKFIVSLKKIFQKDKFYNLPVENINFSFGLYVNELIITCSVLVSYYCYSFQIYEKEDFLSLNLRSFFIRDKQNRYSREKFLYPCSNYKKEIFKQDVTEVMSEINMNSDYEVLKSQMPKYNIFRSHAEQVLYERLIRENPDKLVIPNQRGGDITRKLEMLEEYLTKEEIQYFRWCILDFIIADENGYILAVVELQKGSHHNDDEWIKKDMVKRKVISLLGIKFIEEF